MKKVLSLILAAALVISLSACNRNKDSEEETSPSLIHGTVNDGIYTNSFAEITFTAPKDWEYMTDAELLSNTEDVAAKITNEKLNDIFEEVGLAYDMTAYSEELQSSVGLIFANAEHKEFEGMSEKELINKMIEQIGLDTSGGITEETVSLCGNNYLRLCLTTKTGTGDTGYATFYGRKADNVFFLIVAACTDDFTVADCEACFG